MSWASRRWGHRRKSRRVTLLVEPGGIEPPTSCMPCNLFTHRRARIATRYASKSLYLKNIYLHFGLLSVGLVYARLQTKGTTVGPPKEALRLTSTRLQALKPAAERYEIGDPSCAGLQLRVADTGVKSWHWRFYWHGKRARLVLGVWPKTSLADA